MNPSYGSRIGLVGAASLPGRELAKVLKERNFPILSSVAIEPDKKVPEIPVLDVESEFLESVSLSDLSGDDFDFIFVAAPPPAADAAALVARLGNRAGRQVQAPEPVVIALTELPAEAGRSTFVAPGQQIPVAGANGSGLRLLRAPHAASTVLSTLLSRLAVQCQVARAVAQVFAPASNLGAAAIGELQEQNLKLMSFQKIPQAVFGNQMAFNMLPRLGRSSHAALPLLEARIRHELGALLGGRVPPPAVRVVQVPVFFSTAISIYVELEAKADAAHASKAMEGEGVKVRRSSQSPATQIEAAGPADILVDPVVEDVSGTAGLWLWAAVDDLRLAAQSAVQIAEQFLDKRIAH